MPLAVNLTLMAMAVVLSGLFATLTYSLRDYSRPRLADILARRGMTAYLDRTNDHSNVLAFLTATFRLFMNFAVLVCMFELVRERGLPRWAEYSIAAGATVTVTTLTSVTIPHALALHVGEAAIALFVRPLHWLRVACRPLTAMLHVTETVVKKAATAADGRAAATTANENLQSEILASVKEAEKTGVVDADERRMIQQVIQFGEATAGQVMTARPSIVSLPADAPLETVRELVIESGHSRIPIYDGSLDHVVGMIYARDLIKFVGTSADGFSSRKAARPAFFVPDSKPLQDLLADFKLQKVHMAIVLDEYGGTAGLVTIEDVLEEIVGDLSDEHEPVGPAAFARIDDTTAEADATIGVEEFNRLFATSLPEDAGYETINGFVSTTLGVIPPTGTAFDHDGVTFTVIEAEPQRVKRVKAVKKGE